MHFLSNIPFEYTISLLMFVVVLISLKFAEYRFIKLMAFPVAFLVWLAIEIYQLLKHLQLSFLKKTIQQGNRYKVLFIFNFILIIGIAFYIIGNVFFIMIPINPWYYLPSLFFSTISKYINLVLVPEVIRYGSDKLNTFFIFRWAFKKVSLFWERFEKTKLYRKLTIYTVKIRAWTKQYMRQIRQWLKSMFPEKEKKSFLNKIVNQIKETIARLRS